MANRPDFVRELIAVARETLVIAPHEAEKLDFAVRSRFAGASYLVTDVPPVTVDDINEQLRMRAPVRLIAANLGVSRATIYRRLHEHRASKGK